MKIVVNNIAASSGGALSILQDFYRYIVENDKENEWYFLLGDNYLKETERIKIFTFPKVKKSWIRRLYFDFFTGKSIVNSLNPDLIFSLQNTMIFGTNKKQILYVHQALPFQKSKNFSFLKSNERTLAVYQHIIGKLILYSIKNVDKTIVQTEWMKNAILVKTNVSENKIFNIMPDVPDLTSFSTDVTFNAKCFFYPANREIYKNHQCIYKACELINEELKDYEVHFTLEDTKENAATTQKNIKYLGHITREEVIKKYCNSVLVFPSYIETFGLPLVEAKQMGSIILASDCPFSHEILKDYENAYFFNPFQPETLAILMEKVINGQIVAKENKKETKLNSESSWGSILKIIGVTK